MLRDPSQESVYDHLWEQIGDRFAFLVPLWVIRRPETLTILYYGPTFAMFFMLVWFVVLAIGFALLFFNIDSGAAAALLTLGIPLAVSVFLLLRGTIREAYFFDKTKDSYAFVRQFIHRKEVIEASLGQSPAPV